MVSVRLPGRKSSEKPAATGRAGASGRSASATSTSAKATPVKPKVSRRARIAQLKQAFLVTKRSDPRLVPLMLGAFAVPFVLLLAIGLLIDHPWLLGLLGFTFGLMAAVIVFGRRVQQTAYRQVEGQIGAAAQVLTTMRGDWRVTPAVGFTREQDLVHRVLGRPGIVLVAEGTPGRTKTLIANEKKRLARIVGETPLYDVTVGDAEGQVPLRQLERHVVKLPRNIKPKDVNILDRRLKALPNTALPIPKGPMPTGGRIPRGKTR